MILELAKTCDRVSINALINSDDTFFTEDKKGKFIFLYQYFNDVITTKGESVFYYLFIYLGDKIKTVTKIL